MKRFQISEKEYTEIVEAQRKTRDKNVSKRLRVLEMRYQGLTVKEIAKKLDLHPQSITVMCARYAKEGLKEYPQHWMVNRKPSCHIILLYSYAGVN